MRTKCRASITGAQLTVCLRRFRAGAFGFDWMPAYELRYYICFVFFFSSFLFLGLMVLRRVCRHWEAMVCRLVAKPKLHANLRRKHIFHEEVRPKRRYIQWWDMAQCGVWKRRWLYPPNKLSRIWEKIAEHAHFWYYYCCVHITHNHNKEKKKNEKCFEISMDFCFGFHHNYFILNDRWIERSTNFSDINDVFSRS